MSDDMTNETLADCAGAVEVAVEIGVEHLGVFRACQLEHWLADVHPRIVHEDIDMAELDNRLFGEGIARSLVGDIARNCDSPATEQPDLHRRLFYLSCASGAANDIRARGGESDCHDATQPASRPGNDGHLASKVEESGATEFGTFHRASLTVELNAGEGTLAHS